MITRLTALTGMVALTMAVVFGPVTGRAATALTPAVANQPSITTKVSLPVKLALDQFANIYLTDPRAGGINKFDRTGKWIATFPVTTPQALAVATNLDLIVSQKQQVSVYSNNGDFKHALQHPGGAFKYANGVAIHPVTGYIYVADSLDDCVLVFNEAGQPVATGTASSGKPANSFGSSGNGAGQFAMPTGLAFERSSGQLAIVDTLNGRIQFYDPNSWTQQKSIGSIGSGPLTFSFPEGVAFEYAKDATQTLSRMYVVDAYQSRIQVIDPTGSGTYLGTVGGYGRGAGKLITPSDVAFDPTYNRLIVPNGLGNLAAFALNGSPVPPATNPTPPLLTLVPATDVATNLASISFSGTVDSEAVVLISTDTGAIAGSVNYAPTAMAGITAWQATISGLAAGSNRCTVRAVNSATNPTVMIRNVNYLAAAAVALTLDPVKALSNSSAVTLSGTMENSATVTVNGAAATLNGTGWSFAASLVSGFNQFTVVADKAGRTSSTIATAINMIPTAPPLRLALPATGSRVTSQLLTLRGAVATDENFDRATIVLNNGAPQDMTITNGTFAQPLLLAVGANTILVTISDKAGNVRSDSRTITYDPGQQPVTMTATPLSDGAITDATTINLTGTAPGAVNILLTSGSNDNPVSVTIPVTNGAWAASTISLEPGLNSLTAQGLAANGSPTAVASLAVTQVSPAMPTVAITTPAIDLPTKRATMSVSGSAGAATVTATLNGQTIPVSFAPGTPGTFTLNLSFTSDGQYLLAITATDAFGNSVTTYRQLRYKRSAPTAFTVAAFTGQPLTLAGTAEPGTIIHARQPGGPDLIPPLVVGTAGTWNISVPFGYDPARINLYGADSAGNSTRNGDLNNDGRIDIIDALKLMRRSVGLEPVTFDDLLWADICPYRNWSSWPDGQLNGADVVVLLETILGLH